MNKTNQDHADGQISFVLLENVIFFSMVIFSDYHWEKDDVIRDNILCFVESCVKTDQLWENPAATNFQWGENHYGDRKNKKRWRKKRWSLERFIYTHDIHDIYYRKKVS